LIANPKLVDWFKILNFDKVAYQTLKLKQSEKLKNKIIKGLQKRIEQAQSAELAKTKQIDQFKQSLAVV
jgi:hypothetical protein